MKIQISLSVGKPNEVLYMIARTIKSHNPGHEPGTYTAASCYGRVAWFLRSPSHWKPNDYIMMFSLLGKEVDHCCLYDDHGNIVMDTYEGKPIKKGSHIVYQTKSGHEYRMVMSIRLDRFKREYMQ